MRKLKIAIDFRVENPCQGVGVSMITLVQGLSQLRAPDQEYVILVPGHLVDWIRPYAGEAFSIVPVPVPRPSWRSRLRVRLAAIAPLRRWWFTLRGRVRMPTSDGTAERLGCDVVHFPSQIGYLTRLPSIYHPWDLQHTHLPQFFSIEDRLLRETCYRALCRQARFVCVQTQWGRQDLIEQYGVPEEKLIVIRWPVAFEDCAMPTGNEAAQLVEHFNLPPRFLIYPAVTWPHKNHELILRALALLRQRGAQPVAVFFTGKPTNAQKGLEDLALQLGVNSQIHFLGFVTSQQLCHLLSLATAMVFPSLFEGLGQPLLEAFRMGLPVLCSSATVMPEVTAGAALLFDPRSPEELADAIERALDSPALRERLTADAARVLQDYAATSSMQEFASLYRAAAKPL